MFVHPRMFYKQVWMDWSNGDFAFQTSGTMHFFPFDMCVDNMK